MELFDWIEGDLLNFPCSPRGQSFSACLCFISMVNGALFSIRKMNVKWRFSDTQSTEVLVIQGGGITKAHFFLVGVEKAGTEMSWRDTTGEKGDSSQVQGEAVKSVFVGTWGSTDNGLNLLVELDLPGAAGWVGGPRAPFQHSVSPTHRKWRFFMEWRNHEVVGQESWPGSAVGSLWPETTPGFTGPHLCPAFWPRSISKT